LKQAKEKNSSETMTSRHVLSPGTVKGMARRERMILNERCWVNRYTKEFIN